MSSASAEGGPTGSAYPLEAHPASTPPSGFQLQVRLQTADPAGWWLEYTARGPNSALSVPAPQKPGPADGLWRQTCFEAFVQAGDGTGYHEFNFSPSRQWAVYRFQDERKRFPDDPAPQEGPTISVACMPEELRLRVWVPRHLLPAKPGPVGLSAVLEQADGSLSYWALHHPHADRPDFHHPAGRCAQPMVSSPPPSSSPA